MASNKAPGIDRIQIRVIKDFLGSILPVLTSVINTSIASNMFPTQWKLAEVTPIPKDTDYIYEQASNSGPISLLPVVSKDCERVVYNQFAPFLTSEGRLSNNQSGNKKFYSTETSVIETTDMMDKKNITAMVLLDMSKAFDSVDHKLMISKLQDAGASSSCTEWFRSYLRWLNTVSAVSEYRSFANYGKRKVAAHKLKLGK